MLKKQIAFLLVSLFVLMLLAGCQTGNEPEDTGDTSGTKQSATSADNKNGGQPPATDPVLSSNLYVDENILIFVNPVNKRLSRVERDSGDISILYHSKVWDEFFVVGELIYFKELSSETICSVGLDGKKLEKYSRMPFYKGVMINGVMYFIADPDYLHETVLYSYSLSDGAWSSTVLAGNIQSPMRRTIEFTTDRIYYTTVSGAKAGIMEYIFETQEKSIVFPRDSQSTARVSEIILSSGKLYFNNPIWDGFYVLDRHKELSYYSVPGDRICGVLDDEILFSDAGDILFRGNAAGQVSECIGGIVLADYSSKALILRGTSAGKDKIALVKYPEDVIQDSFEGIYYKTYKNGGYALVFMYDWEFSYFVDMEQGDISQIQTGQLSLSEVSLDKYLEQAKNGGVIPSQDELKDALPMMLAKVFAEAAAQNDRITLNILLPKNNVLPPYSPVYLKSWKIEASEYENSETSIVYKIKFVPYSEMDLFFSDYWPGIFTSGTLALSRTDGSWKIVYE